MSVRVTTASLIALACLATGVALADVATSSAEIAASLFDTLSATARPCDESAAEIDLSGSPVACAHVAKGWGPVKKALREMERELPDLRKMSEFATHFDGLRQRFLLGSDGAVGVAFDDQTRSLVVFLHHPCWSAADLERFEVQVARQALEHGSLPSHSPRPDYPEQARLRRVEGTVVYHALVRADGTVADACAVHSSFRGVGFERAGLDALRQWRYQATPHNLLMPVKVDWSIQ